MPTAIWFLSVPKELAATLLDRLSKDVSVDTVDTEAEDSHVRFTVYMRA